MIKKIFILIYFISFSIFSQTYITTLSLNDITKIKENVVLLKQKGLSVSFNNAVVNANLSSTKIDSLLFLKEQYKFIEERISDNEKLRDDLLLYSRNSEIERLDNFISYRKSISDLFPKDQFYLIYKTILDPKIELSIIEELNKLKVNYEIDSSTESKLRDFIIKFKKETCLLEEYYKYDSKLSSYKVLSYNSDYEIELKNKIIQLELKQKFEYSNYTSKAVKSFVRRAESIDIPKEKIQRLVTGIEHLNKELNFARNVSNLNDSNVIYTIDSPSYHGSTINKKIARFISSTITLDEYKQLFDNQLSFKVRSESIEKLDDLIDQYQLSLKDRDRTLLSKWIYVYVEKEIAATHYYQYETSLMKSKRRVVRIEADRKYREIISKISKKPIDFIEHLNPNEKKFISNAEKQGVDIDKAYEVLEACTNYQIQKDELYLNTKYNKKHIYYIDTNSRNYLRDSFKKYLTNKLTQTEYEKLFWEQLKPQIEQASNIKFSKAQEVYNFNGEAYDQLKEFIDAQTVKEIVVKQYYSYSKKISRQKLKALHYKFENEYSEKINELKQLNKS